MSLRNESFGPSDPDTVRSRRKQTVKKWRAMKHYKSTGNEAVAYPGILFGGRGGSSTSSVEDRGQRERGSGGGSPLVRGSGGSCNLIQEISFHIVRFS